MRNAGLHAEVESIRQIHQERKGNLKLEPAVADIAASRAKLELRLDRQGRVPDIIVAIVAPQVQLSAQDRVADAGGMVGLARRVVFRARFHTNRPPR